MDPTLFNIMFSAVPKSTLCAGFPFRYRFDGKLLNLRRLQAKSKVQTDVLDEAAPVAEWVRSLNFSALNHSIISPL